MHFPLLPRHPELVSGSIARHTRSKRGQAQPHRQVMPIAIGRVDQADFPLPVPVLELLLARDRGDHVAEHLKMDQPVHLVARRKPRRRRIAVLPKAGDEIGRHADIQRAIVPARQNIDARVALLPHGPERAAKWTLKQVQGDEKGVGMEVSSNLPVRCHPLPSPHTRHHPQARHPEQVSEYVVRQSVS